MYGQIPIHSREVFYKIKQDLTSYLQTNLFMDNFTINYNKSKLAKIYNVLEFKLQHNSNPKKLHYIRIMPIK
jgi:hypothetical protein